MAAGDIVPAVVMAVDARDERRGIARVRFGSYTADLGPSGLSVDAADARRRTGAAGRSRSRSV